MNINDKLGERMKNNYENVSKTNLMKRTPIAIRIDGRAFHTFTKSFEKPFDNILMSTMQETMKYLCENIQGCKFGYTQSDEITLILTDYDTFETDAWFDYKVQKVCSVAASMATLAFNKYFVSMVNKYGLENNPVYQKAIEKGAMFDARCFNIPKEEVVNLVYWRQLDAMRNSIQMVAHANFSQKKLQGKSCSDIKEMLKTEKNIEWEKYAIDCQRGAACVKVTGKLDVAGTSSNFCYWSIDTNMPILKDEGRKYLEKLI